LGVLWREEGEVGLEEVQDGLKDVVEEAGARREEDQERGRPLVRLAAAHVAARSSSRSRDSEGRGGDGTGSEHRKFFRGLRKEEGRKERGREKGKEEVGSRKGATWKEVRVVCV
jgi:hypothetical protein